MTHINLATPLYYLFKKLNRFAALFYLFDQTYYIKVINQKTFLLQQPSKGGFMLADDAPLEGSYLYYHKKDCVWI